MDVRKSTPVEVLCNGYSAVVTSFPSYWRALRFEGRLDYAHLRRLFKDFFMHEKFVNDGMLDWSRTARYASINAHIGLEQGRWDVLEAIGYGLMYFCRRLCGGRVAAGPSASRDPSASRRCFPTASCAAWGRGPASSFRLQRPLSLTPRLPSVETPPTRTTARYRL